MSDRPQSFESHTRLVTGYHKVLPVMILVLLIWTIVMLVRDFAWAHVIALVAVLALLVTAVYARTFPLGVQDRLIRLEERLRMERVLPDDIRARAGDLTTDQLIALRFASDEELPDLVRQVLDGSLVGRKEIKAAVKGWRADHERI